MSVSAKGKSNGSPLCPWNISAAKPTPTPKVEAEAEDSSNSKSERLGPTAEEITDALLTWKEQSESNRVTPVKPQPTDSVECVCGNYPNLIILAESLHKNNISFRADSTEFKEGIKIEPRGIKRVSLVCCRVKSCKGLSHFPRIKTLFISDGMIPELLWDELELSHTLKELSIVYSDIKEIEMMKFSRLSKLQLWANKLTNLNFLGQGLPSLKELNVAENRITTLHEENLFKCFNLEILNLSGNPICAIPDLKALKVCHALTSLFLNDVLHSDCPIVSICSYRHLISSLLENLQYLDGIEIKEEDREVIFQYSEKSVVNDSQSEQAPENVDNIEDRTTLLENAKVDLKIIERRLYELQVVHVHCTRVMRIMNIVPGMCNHVPCLKRDVQKMEIRISTLRTLSNKIFKETAKKLKIGRWIKGVQTWLNKLDLDTFGSCQGELLYSSLRNSPILIEGDDEDKEKIANDFIHFIRTSSCQYSHPKKSKVTIESVFIMNLHAMETGIQRIYLQSYAVNSEPEFVKLQASAYDYYRKYTSAHTNRPKSPNPNSPNPNRIMVHGFYDYNREAQKIIQKSFRNPAWKPEYKNNYPDSIPGLPDPGPIWYMFLICPDHKRETPLEYLHRIVTGNSQGYKNILLTTCAWKAMNRRNCSMEPFSILLVVKVLKDALIPIEGDKVNEALHHDKLCQTYCLDGEVTFTPAFILCLSFLPLEKKLYSTEAIERDVICKTQKRLRKYSAKLGSAMKGRRIRLSKATMFLNKTEDNTVVTDLTSLIGLSQSKEAHNPDLEDAELEKKIFSRKETKSFIEDGQISHFLGDQSLHRITKLKLCCNHLTQLNGLQGLKSLRSLDISYNKFTSLESLTPLVNLIEFKVQFNELQSCENCLEVLANNFTRLLTVELLPNPFKDISDWSFIPILIQKKINKISRVDAWVLPFNNSFNFSKIRAPKLTESKY